jgi:5-methyltetrahydrofolate--homocysteine methyltransferase
MKESIVDTLSKRVLVADGAMGTMLQAYDLPAGTLPELWNVEHPEVILAIHRAYRQAGAEIITANTFGGNRLRLAEAGLAEQSVELTQRGVALAREVAGDGAWVAGDVGPTGQILEPYGNLTVGQAEDAYAEQVVALAQAGADLLLIETEQDIEEACCAVRMARAHTHLPVFCTFAFNAKGRTMMGLRPGDAAMRAQEAGAHGVGANCGEGPLAIIAALEGMRAVTQLPLVAQTNAGVPQMGTGARTIWDVTPEQMAEHVHRFAALGARIIGGCCGTTPAHIAAIAAALRS